MLEIRRLAAARDAVLAVCEREHLGRRPRSRSRSRSPAKLAKCAAEQPEDPAADAPPEGWIERGRTMVKRRRSESPELRRRSTMPVRCRRAQGVTLVPALAMRQQAAAARAAAAAVLCAAPGAEAALPDAAPAALLACSAAAAAGAALAAPRRRTYYVSLTPGCGTVFDALARLLLSTGRWAQLAEPEAPPDEHPGSWQPATARWSCCGQPQRNAQCMGPRCAQLADLILGDKCQVEGIIDVWARQDWLRQVKQGRIAGVRAGVHVLRGPSALARLSKLDRLAGNIDTRLAPLRINYLLGSRRITLKTKMVATLRSYRGTDVIPWPQSLAPATFVMYPRVLRAHSQDERRAFRQAWEQGRLLRGGASPSNIWCAKPSNGAKGAGIKISRSYDELVSHVDDDPEPHPWVVQQYIEHPLLLERRKFDIRVWVLVCAPFTILYYRRGVCRTTSCDYATEGGKLNLADSFAHLTNNAIQKQGSDFSKYEQDNFLWFEDAAEKFAALDPPVSFEKQIVPQMKKMVVSALRAARHHFIDAPAPLRPFQLMGFDFIPDASGRVWLLEVNGSPAIAHTPQYTLEDWMVSDMAEHILGDEWPGAVDALRERREAEGRRNDFELLYEE
eukprot:TRINITY_DN3352_c1_g1_i1.p1 TRINITY_DN3352_c1_g1~~TRINITY_DN3352_c1_g1_i1.p1  ORF type:complete len:644 (+),score=245.13 TRINITY_DN3352_c1_g1_i1:80-1933(+)